MSRQISISARQFDPNGNVLLLVDPSSDTKMATRRVSRTATLDGGCVITDTGFSHADRTFSITATPRSSDEEQRLMQLHERYALVTIATDDGVYVGAIERIARAKSDRLTMRILVKEKISG